VEQRKGRKSVIPVLNIFTDDVGIDFIGRQLDSVARLHFLRFCLQHPQFPGEKYQLFLSYMAV